MLERGKDTKIPLATVSLGSDEISLGSDESSDACPCVMRIRRAQIQMKSFLEVFGFAFKSWCDGAKEQIEP